MKLQQKSNSKTLIRLQYFTTNNQSAQYEPDVMQLSTHATLPNPKSHGQDPRSMRAPCTNNTIRRIMTNSRQEMEKVLNDT